MIWVSDKTEFILKSALFNFAQKLNEPASKVQLVITTYDEKEKTPAFRVLINGNPAKIDHGQGSCDEHVTFLEILNVPFDSLNYTESALPFLAEAIERLANELNCPADHINVIIFSDDTLTVFVNQDPKIPSDEWETVAQGPLYIQLYQLIPAHRENKEVGLLNEDQSANIDPATGLQRMEVRPVDIPDKKKFIRHMNLRTDIFQLEETE